MPENNKTIKINMPPVHPGAVIRELILPTDIKIGEAAKQLGVSRQSLDALLNQRRSLSPAMAFKIETVFGGTARSLLAIQTRYDLYKIHQNPSAVVGGLTPYRHSA